MPADGQLRKACVGAKCISKCATKLYIAPIVLLFFGKGPSFKSTECLLTTDFYLSMSL